MNAARTSRLATSLFALSALVGIQITVHADPLPQLAGHHAIQGDVITPANLLSMGKVIAKLEQAGFSHITEVELDDGHYEVEARNRQGQRVELEVHAATGKIMRTELDQ
ncbi:MAG: PepSY domain-containing protein [Comamonas sp.]|nr:PepSY domain-containing protein [Comamonas sp.]